MYRCFVCEAKGGTIDLVMRHLHMDFKEACRWLADQHNIILDEWQPAKTDEEPKAFDASRYERYFEHSWLNESARKFLFTERMLDERVVRWCRLTSWTDRKGVPWLQIPYYNMEGQLVGVQNRNLVKGALPRFRFPKGSECGIYNLPVLRLLKSSEPLFITEGCSDCWAMLSAGHKAIAIPSATLLTKKDEELLRSLSASQLLPSGRSGGGYSMRSGGGFTFHMFPDRDEPGERLFLQLQKVLPTLVHHQLPPDCKDFSDYYLKTNWPI
jgi:DNA primase